MSKAVLVEKIADKAKLTKVDADRALKAFISVVSESLKNGEDVSLVGFGTFSIVDRAEREGRNPLTGEAITIAAKKVVKFKPGKTLKEEVGG
ncbi:MAG: HU family DNA-binding protein [Chlorobiaceae bacterium]|jgi:DNA-binding protein HU-beta|nr:HU family DNA-binding protein [Chlorobiaceae bacterium]